MSRKSAMIYPFDKEFLPLIKFEEVLNKFNITSAVSLDGWGYVGKDIGSISYEEKNNIIVEDNFESALHKCDTVIFNKSQIPLNKEKTLLPKINQAINSGKNIICLIDLNDLDKEQIEEQCKKNNVKCDFYNDKCEYNYDEDLEEFIKVDEINTPIVFVMGLSENTNKFDVQLGLRKKFLDNGYKVSQIGTRSYSNFLGFHPMPDFMFDSSIAEHKKIVLFNRYVKNIEKVENPDVLIIGIPGGIIPINSTYTNNFGITAFEISRAVTPDATVLCVHFGIFNQEYFDNITPLLKYRFGVDADCFYVNNTVLDFMNQDIQNDISLINVNPSKVAKEVERTQKEINMPVYSSTDAVYERIEGILSSYSVINSF